MFLPEGSADAALRSTLSRQADLAFAEAARDQPDAVLVSFWRRPELSPTAGTPTDWLQDDAGLVEVHCRCSIETALHRFTTRSRHSVHGDVHRTVEQLTMQFSSLAALGPLGIGRLVEVDTAAAFDIDEIVTALEPSRRT